MTELEMQVISSDRSLARGVKNEGYGSVDKYNGDSRNDLSYRGTENGHREMAIDCPPSFVGSKKETPRYPRPLSVIQNSAKSSPRGSLSRSSEQLSTSDQMKPDAAQLQRIKHYQEDVQKRKEREERVEKENEFLRASLRSSKKLQDLESKRRTTGGGSGKFSSSSGIINPTYQAEEDDFMDGRGGSQKLRKSDKTYPVVPLDVRGVLQAVDETQKYLQHPDDQKEIDLLSQFVLKDQFQRLLCLHNKLVEASLRGYPSAQSTDVTGQESCRRVLELFRLKESAVTGTVNSAVKELTEILNDTHFQNLLFAYDKTSALKSLPVKSVADGDDERQYMYDRASQYGEDSIKIVRLQKSADPLGATIRNEGDAVVIGRIVRGGIADKSGLLREGDEILEINGVDVRGKNINEVCDLMASLTGVLTFLINPTPEHGHYIQDDSAMHVRAHFTYDPEDDQYIPCRELGISFVKGDILHVVNYRQDQRWWQAYREGEDDQSLAGLVPSKEFQLQRESLKQLIVADAKENQDTNNRCHCTHRRHKKKQRLYTTEEEEAGNIATYEEVALYYPQPNRKRPIVLIGPPNIGCQELRERLVNSDVDRFSPAVPHTSRPAAVGESHGRDYYFVSRPVFEADVTRNKFVEYGEHDKQLFGTSTDSVRHVINSGKICVLHLQPQSIRKIRTSSDLKPYFVFIAPPNIEKLRQLHQKRNTRFSDDELKDTIENARQMEEAFGHYFDTIIVNQDFDKAFDELVGEVNRLEVEPQWVPVEWVS